jgi:SAM-dependent methyltransferase
MEHYKSLQLHYERRLAEHGPTAKGMDWPNAQDLEKRFTVLTDVIDLNQTSRLLDLGCGVGLLIDHLEQRQLINKFIYLGVDISPKMILAGKELHSSFQFEVRDVLQRPYNENQFDYIIMNGLLTEKQEMTQAQMLDFAKQIIMTSYRSCSKGISFNVMSSHVDWKRDDLFHWELDDIVSFLIKNCSRKIRIMMDYGLYEYTVHLKK